MVLFISTHFSSYWKDLLNSGKDFKVDIFSFLMNCSKLENDSRTDHISGTILSFFLNCIFYTQYKRIHELRPYLYCTFKIHLFYSYMAKVCGQKILSFCAYFLAILSCTSRLRKITCVKMTHSKETEVHPGNGTLFSAKKK